MISYELFPELGPDIETANKIRVLRHSFSYPGIKISQEDISFIINFANKFGDEVKEILKV